MMKLLSFSWIFKNSIAYLMSECGTLPYALARSNHITDKSCLFDLAGFMVSQIMAECSTYLGKPGIPAFCTNVYKDTCRKSYVMGPHSDLKSCEQHLIAHFQWRFLKNLLVWWPVSVGGLDFEYACSSCKLKGYNFSVWGRT